MFAKKIIELDEPFETLDESEIEECESEEDSTILLLHNISISPDSLNGDATMIAKNKEFQQEEAVMYNSDSGIRKLSGAYEEDELENIDQTRVYTAVEWELLQTLMKVL